MNRAHYKIMQDFLHVILMGLVTGVVFSMAVTGVVFLLSGPARAAAEEPDPALALDSPVEAKQGSLLFKSEAGYLTVPTLETDVSIRITGMLARVKVKQRFHNATNRWMEGVYVFPLPEDAAVDHLEMRIGARMIEGQIKEREEAARTYATAKAEGRKATLLEQERPNIFTTSVANIGPDEDVAVVIEYQQTLRYDQGVFRLRFPMVVAPRYIPGSAIVEGFSGTGWAKNTDQVIDAARITPPVLKPGKGVINPVSLSIELDAGFPLARLDSSFHRIKTTDIEGGRKRIVLDTNTTPANRDFELVWAPDTGDAPRAAMFTETRDGKTYALLMVMPPLAAKAQPERAAREVVFVIDTSGSMSGTSIEQARQALLLALSRLTPRDRFNVIQFNSVTDNLFGSAVAVTPRTIQQAQKYVQGLKANGGTEMAPALSAALANDGEGALLRQVIFLTDGSVGNEEALFDLIHKRLGRSRLFTVGIGSAPNSHFMSRAAEFGHGTFTYVGNVAEVGEKMSGLFSKLENPALTDIEIKWPTSQTVQMWPARIPDLYQGEPVLVSAALDAFAGKAIVAGKRGGEPWEVTLALDGGRVESGVNVLWARKKIDALMSSVHDGRDPGVVRLGVVETALEHHLVSKYTSLVAVDVTPTKPDDADSGSAALPVNLPEGWNYERVFGTLPQTATPASLHLLTGLVLMILATALLYLRRNRSHARGIPA